MRRLIGLVAVLALLAGLAVVGDRVAAGYAADRAEKELIAQGFRQPVVAIGGFPFLTQFLSREYRHVALTADALVLEPGRAERVSATLWDVQVDSNSRPRELRARNVEAHGTVRYAEVEKAAGVPGLRIRRGQNGEVRLSGNLTVFGESFAVAARGTLDVTDNRLLVTPTGFEAEGLGELDEQLSALLTEQFTLDYPIPGLPRGVQVLAVQVGATGFLVHVRGRDTVLRMPLG